MKKTILLIFALILVACDNNDDSSSLDLEVGDALFISNATVLGEGLRSSGTANSFLDCRFGVFSVFNKIFPKNLLIAFGTAGGDSCAACVPTYRCNPGASITIESQSLYSVVANPTEFDNDPSLQPPFTQNFTCPPTGIFVGQADGNGNYMKITYISSGKTDVEYLSCYDVN